MTVLCVVQARMGSTRLPGKVVQEVGGRPMLRFMLDRLAGASGLRTVVATSDLDRDDVVEDVARLAGIPVVRGPEDDVLARFVCALDAHPARTVVRLTADCPLTDPALVAAVVERHLAARADYTSNVFPRTYPKGLDVEVMTRDALVVAHAEATDPVEREHVTPFLYRRPERFRLVNVRQDPPLGAQRWTVDTPDDLEFVRRVVARMAGHRFSWEAAFAAVGDHVSAPAGTVELVPAGPGDAEFFRACRNDAEAVRWSGTGRAITADEHAAWFARALDDPGKRVRVATVGGSRVGTARVDVRAATGTVGVAVAPGARGRGFGTELLRALVADCRSDPQVVVLEAVVHPGNVPSLRAFAAAGFAPAGERDGFRVLRRPVHEPIEVA